MARPEGFEHERNRKCERGSNARNKLQTILVAMRHSVGRCGETNRTDCADMRRKEPNEEATIEQLPSAAR